jgi:hypothetical protein
MAETMTAREVYRAYLRGEITAEEIDKRAREFNEARRAENREPNPPKNDD